MSAKPRKYLVYSFRLTPEHIEAIDEAVDALKEALPDQEWNRSSMLRYLIDSGCWKLFDAAGVSKPEAKER